MDDERQVTLSTYRHLRLAMVILLGLLLTSVVVTSFNAGDRGCFEASISGYYFTPARAVFVGALCALGACLIIYRGNTDAEDIALNASGALAFVVAFVPTGLPRTTDVTCSATNIPTWDQLDTAIDNNMTAYLFVSAGALALALALVPRASDETGVRRRALWAFAFALVAATAAFVRWPEGFRDNAHTNAAIAMFAGMLAVVALNALGAHRTRTRADDRYRNAYGFVAAAMFLSGAVIGIAHCLVSDWRHWVLFIEAALLLEFLVFWLIQTVELWRRTTRDAPPVPPPTPSAPPTTTAAQPGPTSTV
jgi:hypothetical protein